VVQGPEHSADGLVGIPARACRARGCDDRPDAVVCLLTRSRALTASVTSNESAGENVAKILLR
jgi:hypothetical protein